MIPIRQIRVNIEKQTNEIFSTLNWHMHPVEEIWFAKTNKFRTNTNRLFIGKTNETKSEFILTRQRNHFESKLPQIIVKGKFTFENGNSILVLKFLPGLFTSLFFILSILIPFIALWDSIYNRSGIELGEIIVMFGIIIPVITLLTAVWELDKTKTIILNLLELNKKKAS